MSAVLESINHAADGFFRGPVFSKFLTTCGIDPKRYWLLMDLFAKLSERDEMQGQLGRQSAALRVSAGLIFAMHRMCSAVRTPAAAPIDLRIPTLKQATA